MEGDVVRQPDPRARIVRARQIRCRAGAPRPEGESGEADALRRRVGRLEEELQSLRNAYAKKISRTEIWAEELEREKDAERAKWVKKQEAEMDMARAAAKIMRGFLESKQRRTKAQMERDREEAARQGQEHAAAEKRMQEAHADELARCASQLEQTKAAYEKSIERHVGVQDSLREELAGLRRKLQQAEVETASKQEDCEQREREVLDLRKKLEAAGGSREDEVLRWERRIKALEEELKRVKKVMTQRRLEEGDRLRKELMEYVKFIVHILPDNWKGYATQGLDGQEFPLSPELQQQLREACARPQGGGPKGHVHPPHPASAPSEPLPSLRTPRPSRHSSCGAAAHASHQQSPYGAPPARAKTAQ